MLSCERYFKNTFGFLILSLSGMACSPFEPRSGHDLNEVRVENPDQIHAATAVSSKPVTGNIFIEFQTDASSGEKKIYSQALFYEAQTKNILFPEVSTSLVEVGLYSGGLGQSGDDDHPGNGDDDHPGNGNDDHPGNDNGGGDHPPGGDEPPGSNNSH